MKDFLNIKLPNFIAICAQPIPVYNTKIVTLQSGKESRYPIQNLVRFKYKISFCRLTFQQFKEFSEFFLVCKGKQFAFKMKDFQDYRINNQVLAQGPSSLSKYPLYRIYQSQNIIYKRRIYKPIVNSIELKSSTDLSRALIDYENGIVDLKTPLIQNEIVKISFSYDIVVRFDFSCRFYNYHLYFCPST